MNEKHMGSSLDDYLAEEGQLAEAEAVASKRVLAFQIARRWRNSSCRRRSWRAA